MVLLTLLIGQKLAIPIFVWLYLVRWGRYGWAPALLYALACWLLLVTFYGWLLSIAWHPSLLDAIVRERLPGWFPVDWLF